MLKLENISKKYDHILFDKLNINFPNKGFFLVMGESGCGKTTLLNIILGIEFPDEGNVFYNNRVLTKKDFLSFRKNEISYIFQDYGLIEYYSIEQNLSLPLINIKHNIKKQDLIDVLNRVGINKKLNTICKNLSGGEKQRVAIARSILIDKNIILCDEPSGSLDPENGEKVLSILKEISKEKLVICVTHNEEYIEKYADYTYLLDKQKFFSFAPKITNKSIENHYEIKRISIKDQLSFSFKSISRKWVRTSVSIISFSLVLIILLISLSFSLSIKSNLNNYFAQYLNYNMLEVSVKQETQINDSLLSLTKNRRPTIDVLKNNLTNYNYSLTYNLNDLFSQVIVNKNIQIQFQPFYDLESTNYGYLNNIANKMRYNDVFINQKAYEIIKGNLDITLKKGIITYDKYFNKAIDNIELNINLNIIKVVDEFDLFSIPTIYYNYYSYQKFFSNIVLNNASTLLGRKVTLFDRYSTLSSDEEKLSSYSYLLWVDKSQVLDISQYLSNIGYHIYSIPLDNQNQILNIFDVAKNVILIFLTICFIIVFVLISVIVYSLIIDRSREIVLFKVHGLSNKNIEQIISLDTIIICLISSFISVIVFQFSISFLNKFIEKNLFISNFLQTDLTIILIVIVISLLFGKLFTKIPCHLLLKKKESELIND